MVTYALIAKSAQHSHGSAVLMQTPAASLVVKGPVPMVWLALTGDDGIDHDVRINKNCDR